MMRRHKQADSALGLPPRCGFGAALTLAPDVRLGPQNVRFLRSRWLPAILILLTGGPARADALADGLDPFVGQPIDVVEMATGKRFVRPLLQKVVVRDGTTHSLRLVEEGQGKPMTLTLRGITKIVAGRETVYESEIKGRSSSQVRERANRVRQEQERDASRARMQAHGVEPWSTLSAEEHAAEVESLKAYVEQVRGVFPDLEVAETHEFIVASDIPPAELKPFLASLDTMHDLLCDLYGIPRGEPVWKGKCLVIAFRDLAAFKGFEQRFMNAAVPERTHGLCHQSSDGRVVMACHRGSAADAFAHMLVHETSHGFNHRWLSPRRLPNWLNEGLAEWVGTQVVPRSRQVPLKEAEARAFMQSTGSLGPNFFTAEHIQPVQYGIASQLVRFLVSRDRAKFAEFVRSIKEGRSAEESFQDSFDASLADLVAAFGRAMNLPGLSP
jgi:hypothetical protein